PFRIPTLDETLAWAEGRAILTLDVKQGVPIARVINAVRRLGAEERVVVITYTLDDLLRYHRQAPDLMLSASATTLEETQALLDSGVDRSRLIAFTGVGEVHSEVIDLLHVHHIRAILGTFDLVDARARQTGPEVFQALIDRGIDVIATDEVPLAAQALRAYALTQVP
ncbi:MAG: glycerophosphodiester phosphodiesterase family protein, partial [Rhodothermales bacterium]